MATEQLVSCVICLEESQETTSYSLCPSTENPCANFVCADCPPPNRCTVCKQPNELEGSRPILKGDDGLTGDAIQSIVEQNQKELVMEIAEMLADLIDQKHNEAQQQQRYEAEQQQQRYEEKELQRVIHRSFQEEKTWSCTFCTVRNPLAHAFCTDCRHDAPVRTHDAPEWACGACTYHNAGTATACHICATKK